MHQKKVKVIDICDATNPARFITHGRALRYAEGSARGLHSQPH
jgi:hypothetical protein